MLAGSIANNKLVNSAITINGSSTSLGGSVNVGTVTSVAATAGTGISVSGSPITGSGTLSITNTAPDQTVVLTAGTGISTSGTYPNFTITNTSPSLGGDVVGAASSTDNAITRFNGTTGKLIQNSAVIIDDTNNVTGVNSLTATTLVVNDNATLGSSNTDSLAVNARISTDLEPVTNNARDIGTNGRNWRDGFFGRNLQTVNFSSTGSTTLGDATADLITANGRFNTDLVPSTDNARDLGTSALKWKQVYATTFTENGSPVVVQTDIGTAPNEIPLNQYLGNLAYQDAANIAGNVGIGGAVTATSGVINANTTTDALRITQLGTGNALLVEDSANPDATPFVVNASGQVITGYTSATITSNYSGLSNSFPSSQQHGTSLGTSAQSINIWDSGSTANTGQLLFSKSKSSTIGTNAAVVSGDFLGAIAFNGADGTNFIPAANIVAAVDGTPDTNDMPGRLIFSTTADGASSPTERMRIDSAGKVGIGSSALGGQNLRIGTPLTGATSANGIWISGQIQSDVTSTANYLTATATQAAGTTTTNLRLYNAEQGTISGTITNQFGFSASSTLTGATNNYGFHSNIASGTGRFNFYAQGTAANVFAGQTSIGGTVGAESLRVTPTASSVNFVTIQGSVASGAPTIFSAGSDTNIALLSSSKGTGSQQFYTNGFAQLQFLVSHTASAVNYLQVTGAATAGAPVLSAAGTDTNIDLALTPKGTGLLRFGTHTVGILAQTGYITVKDAAGNTRNLLVG
jgi:hypothetical protein